MRPSASAPVSSAPCTRPSRSRSSCSATFTEEGYYKWGHGAYVHVKALERDNVDNIYKMLNYYLSGEYRAHQANERGYAGPNMDLGVQFAEENSWAAEEIEDLKWTETKGQPQVREAVLRQARRAQLRRHEGGVAALPQRLRL